MDVLSLLDAVIPDIEMEVGKRVTRSLVRKDQGDGRTTLTSGCGGLSAVLNRIRSFRLSRPSRRRRIFSTGP